jgi:glycosyltransferase involved in cell wall biosynthesis
MATPSTDSSLFPGQQKGPRPAQEATARLPHISVCVCTYKRPDFLRRLLDGLAGQEADGLFTYAIIVADNDYLRSAEPVVASFTGLSPIPVSYCVEPRQNIALTRNRAIENASGDFVAFIDDDEFPTKRWLLTLFNTCNAYAVDGVLGPVKPYFDEQPPRWVLDGKFYDRPTYPTGLVIDGRKGRTGNVLLKKQIFAGIDRPFRPEFLTGEDQDFFRRMIEKGHVFIWCSEALAYEVVPPVRWRRDFMLRRALLRGANTLLHPAFGVLDVVKSLLAVPAYTLLLPVALILGQGTFMIYSVKLFDHLGRLLALFGIRPIREGYVTE